jgi:hypothetical protein
MIISRRYAHRGQYVTVALKDGDTFTGILIAWGPQILRVRGITPDHCIRTREIPTAIVSQVEEAEADL